MYSQLHVNKCIEKKTHQEFLDATSDLESPIGADHKFSVKVAVCICPVLVHLFVTSGDKAVHNTVLCPDLLLSDIRKIQCAFFFFCFSGYLKVQTIPRWHIYVCIWMTMESYYPSIYCYQNIYSESPIFVQIKWMKQNLYNLKLLLKERFKS